MTALLWLYRLRRTRLACWLRRCVPNCQTLTSVPDWREPAPHGRVWTVTGTCERCGRSYRRARWRP